MKKSNPKAYIPFYGWKYAETIYTGNYIPRWYVIYQCIFPGLIIWGIIEYFGGRY